MASIRAAALALRKGVGRLGKDLVVIPRKFPHNDPSTSSRISPMTAAVKVRYHAREAQIRGSPGLTTCTART